MRLFLLSNLSVMGSNLSYSLFFLKVVVCFFEFLGPSPLREDHSPLYITLAFPLRYLAVRDNAEELQV